MKKLDAALTYASWGWKVIPVVPNGKMPATQHGVNDATDDPAKIAAWWAQNPDYNIGIAAGVRSGLIVFDIDPRNGGDDSWAQWVQKNGGTPDGAMQLTAGGGMHYLATYVDSIRSCKLADGIDLLSDGRYFVAYPSTVEGRSYQWESMSDPFDGVGPITIPPQWIEACKAVKKTASPQQSGGLIQGNRNSGLTSLGGAMRRFGMTEAEIMAALSIANETRCEVPLPSSEIAQIARSVSRYEPDGDVAATSGLGSDCADGLLSALVEKAPQDYFFTRATSYLSQPAPLKWIVKGWVPDLGMTMIYGESGCGKTFITLDIACHIAAGLDWHGAKTKKGVAVYLAGEGNYGIRQRVAAWCKAQKISNLDNLIISNKSIDIDSPAAAAQIIRAVKDLTSEHVSVVFIDTVNNHMVGNENDARDTRSMLNAAQIVGQVLDAGVCFVHHVGVSTEAKTRARGSSAWRASMDSQILITNKEGVIEIACTKMKDAQEPLPIFGELQPVPLGWHDEDGAEIVGAVFTRTGGSVVKDPGPKVNSSKSIFERAWADSGMESIADKPYVSRSFLIEFLEKTMKVSNSIAADMCDESGKLIGPLNSFGLIEAHKNGWVVVDNLWISTMVLSYA